MKLKENKMFKRCIICIEEIEEREFTSILINQAETLNSKLKKDSDFIVNVCQNCIEANKMSTFYTIGYIAVHGLINFQKVQKLLSEKSHVDVC